MADSGVSIQDELIFPTPAIVLSSASLYRKFMKTILTLFSMALLWMSCGTRSTTAMIDETTVEYEGFLTSRIADSSWTWNFDDGSPRVTGEYQNGSQEGAWSYYWENGNKKAEGSFSENRQTGAWTLWHENGEKYKEGSYENGKKTGDWTVWWNNGTKGESGPLRDGKWHGTWTYWNPDGKFDRTEVWNSGNFVR
jgi:antitoxin component YwqK of YwqJK toxin-antitoxin module